MLNREAGAVLSGNGDNERRVYFTDDYGALLVDWEREGRGWVKRRTVTLNERDLTSLWREMRALRVAAGVAL